MDSAERSLRMAEFAARQQSQGSWIESMVAGALAGLAVDLTLYPMDTIKTRLQSKGGLAKTGSFRALYAGLPSVLVGSAPGSALFFMTYEGTKRSLEKSQGGAKGIMSPLYAQMIAASVGEMVACCVRVPTEVLKQRVQANPFRSSVGSVLLRTLQREGISGLFRGYRATIIREVPFSFIQFPLWEYFKTRTGGWLNRKTSPLESAACGALAGVMASGITTPLDVAKTRIMLEERVHPDHRLTVRQVIAGVYREKGLSGVFSGLLPRMMWIGVGGFVFFGAYDLVNSLIFLDSTATVSSSNVHVNEPLTWLDSLFARISDLGRRLFFKQAFDNKPKTFDEVIIEARIMDEYEKSLREKKKLSG